MYKISLVISSVLLFAGCASISGETSTDITILTPGATKTMCILENDSSKVKAFPPQTVKFKNANQSLDVTCLASENRKKTVTVKPTISKLGRFGSAFLLPGSVYDHHTGALYTYPELIEVDFSDIKRKSEPLPDYQNPMRIADPESAIENFGPSEELIRGEKQDQEDLEAILKKYNEENK